MKVWIVDIHLNDYDFVPHRTDAVYSSLETAIIAAGVNTSLNDKDFDFVIGNWEHDFANITLSDYDSIEKKITIFYKDQEVGMYRFSEVPVI